MKSKLQGIKSSNYIKENITEEEYQEINELAKEIRSKMRIKKDVKLDELEKISSQYVNKNYNNLPELNKQLLIACIIYPYDLEFMNYLKSKRYNQKRIKLMNECVEIINIISKRDNSYLNHINIKGLAYSYKKLERFLKDITGTINIEYLLPILLRANGIIAFSEEPLGKLTEKVQVEIANLLQDITKLFLETESLETIYYNISESNNRMTINYTCIFDHDNLVFYPEIFGKYEQAMKMSRKLTKDNINFNLKFSTTEHINEEKMESNKQQTLSKYTVLYEHNLTNQKKKNRIKGKEKQKA